MVQTQRGQQFPSRLEEALGPPPTPTLAKLRMRTAERIDQRQILNVYSNDRANNTFNNVQSLIVHGAGIGSLPKGSYPVPATRRLQHLKGTARTTSRGTSRSEPIADGDGSARTRQRVFASALDIALAPDESDSSSGTERRVRSSETAKRALEPRGMTRGETIRAYSQVIQKVSNSS